MPALMDAVGFDAVLAMHQAIVGSIPPEQMAASLAIMLPSMDVDDRAELLGGMRAGAPAEVFEGVWALAGSVLAPKDHQALAIRLDLSCAGARATPPRPGRRAATGSTAPSPAARGRPGSTAGVAPPREPPPPEPPRPAARPAGAGP